MGTSGEELSYESEDSCFHSGEFSRDFHEVYTMESTRFRIVLPCNSKKVAGVEVPKADVLEFLLYFFRDEAWIFHLSKGWHDDVSFTTSLGRVFDGAVIELDIRHLLLLLFICVDRNPGHAGPELIKWTGKPNMSGIVPQQLLLLATTDVN